MTLRKIRDLRRVGNGAGKTGHPISDATREENRKRFIINNPMKNPDIAKKNANARRNKPQNNPTKFKEGNKLGTANKGRKHTQEENMINALKHTGKKNSNLQREVARQTLLKNNPMKNPGVVQKIKDYYKHKKELKKIKSNEKHRLIALEHPEVKKHWFKKKVTIEMENKIIEYYNDPVHPMSTYDLATLFGISAPGIRRILKRNKVIIRDHKCSAKVNNVIRNLKNKKEVKDEKTIDDTIDIMH